MSDKAEIHSWVCLPLGATRLQLAPLPGVPGSSQFYCPLLSEVLPNTVPEPLERALGNWKKLSSSPSPAPY